MQLQFVQVQFSHFPFTQFLQVQVQSLVFIIYILLLHLLDTKNLKKMHYYLIIFKNIKKF